MLQLVPKPGNADSIRNKAFAPQRDVAHAGSAMVRQAMTALDDQWFEPWFQQFMDDYGQTTQDLAAAAPLFAKAFQSVIKAENPVVALDEAGFTKLASPIQMAFYTKLGQVLLAWMWSGIKDVNYFDAPTPSGIQDLESVAMQILPQLSCLQRSEPPE